MISHNVVNMTQAALSGLSQVRFLNTRLRLLSPFAETGPRCGAARGSDRTRGNYATRIYYVQLT
jgi:hypothetical protein